ncbi:amino acid ABC transporter substrate-binding protein [Halioglobus maricola]|uniref:Amino acid ABC transporter substrate-binding protein n=1 Tax=Halioglobus maricola TaxID=2601894 RepID=A0A5P9NLK2_9GAMM|nr:ABC transporter substrate-binding protein [Halioglobus maricola]QFU75808.1 amino acid ABC transporter substrate-binding protein [Halioglobus maricola]
MFRQMLFSLVLVFTVFSVQAAGVLKVGLSADYQPLHFKQDGKIYGVEPDNARAVGKILGYRVELVELPFEELLPALNAGKVDVIMSGISITEQRSQNMLFADPYLKVGQMPILHQSKLGSHSQPWAIYREGVRVGVEPLTTGAKFAEEKLANADIKYFDNPDQAFAGLREDQIDLYLHDAPTSWQLANSTENSDLISLYTPLTEELLAWVVQKDNAALAQELNQALELMKANGSLEYILNRWIPVSIEVAN